MPWGRTDTVCGRAYRTIMSSSSIPAIAVEGWVARRAIQSAAALSTRNEKGAAVVRHVRESTWSRYASRNRSCSRAKRASKVLTISASLVLPSSYAGDTRGRDRIYPVDELRALRAKPPEPFPEPVRPGLVNHGRALEAVTLAYEGGRSR